MSDSAPLTALDAIPREQIPAAIARLAARAMEAPKPNGTPPEGADDYLTAKDVAKRLGFEDGNVRWVQRHAEELGGVKLSPRCLRFPRAKVERYLRSRAR